jgi:hypothetical protein
MRQPVFEMCSGGKFRQRIDFPKNRCALTRIRHEREGAESCLQVFQKIFMGRLRRFFEVWKLQAQHRQIVVEIDEALDHRVHKASAELVQPQPALVFQLRPDLKKCDACQNQDWDKSAENELKKDAPGQPSSHECELHFHGMSVLQKSYPGPTKRPSSARTMSSLPGGDVRGQLVILFGPMLYRS